MRTNTRRVNKRARLMALGRQRQESRWHGYKCVGDYHGGRYESPFVSPYTKTANNVSASLMILLQDWSSDERLCGALDQDAAALGYTPSLSTNINLIALLRSHFAVGLADVFGTNVFPFIKIGGMTARIRSTDMVRAAKEFALPQIAIVGPVTAACLGLPAFNAVRQAAGLQRVATIAEGIESPFLFEHTQVWCQAHTGQLGRNNRNRGGVDRVSPDWARMAAAHNERCC